MALFGDFGQAINNALGVFGTMSGGLGVAGQLGQAVLTPLVQPTQNLPMAVGPTIQATPTAGAGGTILRGAATVARGSLMAMTMRSITGPILVKIAQATGRSTMSIRQATRIIRKASRWIEASAVAGALGITVGEMASVLMADAQRPRRRMNPANITALRRSLRRVNSFHRLCGKADVLRRSRSRRSARSGCSTIPAVVRNG